MRKKIFILLSRVPFPLDKGDKLRAFYQIRELSQLHNIYLCALSDSPVHPEAEKNLHPFVKEIRVFSFSKLQAALRLLMNLFSDKPFQVAYFFSRKTKNKIESYIAEVKPDHVYCQLIRMAEYIRSLDIDKTLDYQDAFSAGLLRRFKYAPWYLKPVLCMEYHRVRKYEETMAVLFRKKTIISIPDRNLFTYQGSEEIQIVANGVDDEYFKKQTDAKIFDVVFCGNMAYPPNEDAAAFLVNEIMPLVWNNLPNVKVAIAGTNPGPKVRRLATSNVVVTGWVNDIRFYYSSSKIMVAPLRIGTGLQNKILEAMAMQVPVVASELANQAIMAKHGEQILIACSPLEYAKHILSLLNKETLYNHLSINGLNFARNNFQWSVPCLKLEKIIISPAVTGNK